MKIMSKIILTALVFVGTVIPQSIEANYQLDYVTVHYTWVARAMESSLDFTGGYDLMGSWPSSATPAFHISGSIRLLSLWGSRFKLYLFG